MPEKLTISGIELKNPIMVGAGPIKTEKDLRTVLWSESAAVVMGSITKQPRGGNEGRTYYRMPRREYAINSKGLPNPGLEYYEKRLSKFAASARAFGKPLIMSIAGEYPQEYAELAGTLISRGAHGIEANVACPNMTDKDGKQKRISGFWPDLTGNILYHMKRELGAQPWVSVKLPPFSDPAGLANILSIIAEAGFINAVVTTNTFPNAFIFDGERSAIDPAGGLGGMSGRAMKPVGLGQVVQSRTFLPKHIHVIGGGGINNHKDMTDYLNLGAIATFATSVFIDKGPSSIKHILENK